jgi:hypothetical protein
MATSWDILPIEMADQANLLLPPKIGCKWLPFLCFQP